MKERMNQRTNNQTNKRINKQTNKQTNNLLLRVPVSSGWSRADVKAPRDPRAFDGGRRDETRAPTKTYPASV